jgi:hypothetical protein
MGLKKILYFLSLVWRISDSQKFPDKKEEIYRISIKTAWEVVNIRYPKDVCK